MSYIGLGLIPGMDPRAERREALLRELASIVGRSSVDDTIRAWSKAEGDGRSPMLIKGDLSALQKVIDWKRSAQRDEKTPARHRRPSTPRREGGVRRYSAEERAEIEDACRAAGAPGGYVQACASAVMRTEAPVEIVVRALSFGINPGRDRQWREKLAAAEEMAASSGSILGIPRNLAIFGGIAGAGTLLWLLVR